MEKIKRIVLILIILLLTVFLCSCNSTENETKNFNGTMTLIYNDGWCVIYRDNRTGVQYFSRANCGTCVMVDADGEPYIEK